jgi:uncharacterized membrane protein YgcG
MSRFVFLLTFMSAAAFISPVLAADEPDQVITDGGQFFSEDAIQRALRVNQRIAEFFGKEVVVAAYDHLPTDKMVEFQVHPDQKAKLYADWINELAQKRHVNGVLILLVRHPGHLQIAVGQLTRRKLFTLKDRDALVALMLEHIRAQRFDQALVQGMQFVLERMWANEHPDFQLPAERNPATQSATTQSVPTTRPATQSTGGDSDYRSDASLSH